MKKMELSLLTIPAVLLLAACSNQPPPANDTTKKVAIKEVVLTYSGDSVQMNGYIAYDSSIDVRRPVVLVVHEWWGQNDYAKKRTRDLAALGYLAFALDMYGNGLTADDPGSAGKLAMPFYLNPVKAKNRFDAALKSAMSHKFADTTQVAAIGYCFGGSVVLNMARLGEDLLGVVSFHGNLIGVPPSKDKLKTPVLVCHGEADQFVKAEEVDMFKRQMDSIGALYTFKSYPNATHAFSNPNATEKGKKFDIPIAYNAEADTASWNDMKVFFGTIFRK